MVYYYYCVTRSDHSGLSLLYTTPTGCSYSLPASLPAIPSTCCSIFIEQFKSFAPSPRNGRPTSTLPHDDMGVTTKDTKYFGQFHDTTTSSAAAGARETHRLTHFPQSWSFLSLSFTPKKSNDDDGGGRNGMGSEPIC